MQDEVVEDVRDWFDRGYAENEIRDYLSEQGYGRQEIDDLLERARSNPNAGQADKDEQVIDIFWWLQKYSWLVFFLIATYAYVASSLGSILVLGRFMGQQGPVPFFLICVAIVIFQLAAGVFRIFKEQRAKGLPSLVGSITVVGFYLLMAVPIFSFKLASISNLFGPKGQLGSSMLVSVSITAVLLVSAFSLKLFFSEQLGRLSYFFLVLFFLVFAGLWLNHLVSVGSATSSLEDSYDQLNAPHDHVMLATNLKAQVSILKQNLRRVRLMPPPFSKYSVQMAAYSRIKDFNVLYRNIKSKAEEKGIVELLKASEEVCGGTLSNFKDNLDSSDRKYSATVLFLYNFMIDKFKDNSDSVAKLLDQECREKVDVDCGPDLEAWQSFVDSYLAGLRRERKLIGKLLAFDVNRSRREYERLKVEDCSSETGKYYSLKLLDVNCGKYLTLKLKNTGTRLTNITSLFICDHQGDVLGKKKYRQGKLGASETKVLSASVKDIYGAGTDKERMFSSRQEYIIELSFTNSQLDFSTKCTGR